MSDKNGSAIEGAGLRKAYGGVLALDDATFSAAPGEVHALVGENGAGKSTMIKALAGVIRPDEGRVSIGGEEVRLRSPEHALRRGVATVFQELTLLPRMTVAENLLMGHEPRGGLGLIRRRELAGRGRGTAGRARRRLDRPSASSSRTCRSPSSNWSRSFAA